MTASTQGSPSFRGPDNKLNLGAHNLPTPDE